MNDKTLGVTVQPCKIYEDPQKDDQLVTWKQISRKKCSPRVADSINSCNFPRELRQLDPVRQRDDEREIDTITSENRTAKDLSIGRNESDGELKVYELDKVHENHISWVDSIQNLNQTYLIRDSEDIEQLETFQNKWTPIRHSPRVEFYFKDTREAEVCEVNEKKSKRSIKANDEEIRVAEHTIEELKIDNEDTEDESCVNNEYETEVSGHRTKETRPDNKDKKDIRKTNDTNAANLDELFVNEKYKEDKQITMDEDTTEAKEIFEEMKNLVSNISQNLSAFHEHKLPTFDVASLATLEAPIAHEESSSREFRTDSIDNADLPSNDSLFHSKHEDSKFHFDDRSDLTFSDSFVDQNQDCNMHSDMCPEDKIWQYKSDKCRNEAEECFDPGDLENNKNEEADCDADVDDDSNIRRKAFASSMDGTEVTVDEGSRQELDKRVISDVDYGDDNIITKDNTQGDNEFESLITLKDDVVAEGPRCCREKVVPEASVNLPRRVSSSTRSSARERSTDCVEMRHKIRGSMNLLRDSTDSLISSVEFVELASIEQQPKASHKREIIKIIRPSRRSRMFKILPDIPGEPVETRVNGERSYWERASKISQSRLISLDPSCHVEYKLAKKNPRVRILSPVPSSPLIQPR